MNTNRRATLKLFALTPVLYGVSAPAFAHDDDDGFRAGKVFTSSNAVGGNELLVYSVAEDGALTLQVQMGTGGQGSGGGLGNQGAVTLSEDGRFLFVVNAASNTVTTFRPRRSAIDLVSTVDSGGLGPISVAEHDGLVYVLNANGAGNVAGFRNFRGHLVKIPGSSRPLSASGGTGPAQVGFAAGGDVLVITEKATNKLTSYLVRHRGLLGERIVTASAGLTPFGFAVDRRGNLLVSEAFGGAPGASAVSSYTFDDHEATPVLVSASVGTTQAAACWVVVTPNGRFAYVTNTGSGTVSSYRIHRSGRIALARAVAGDTGAGSGPIDAAVSPGGRRLFVLNSGAGSIASFVIASDGTLGALPPVGGVPASANGLAAN